MPKQRWVKMLEPERGQWNQTAPVVTMFFSRVHSLANMGVPVSPKNVFDKTVKPIRFVKSWPQYTWWNGACARGSSAAHGSMVLSLLKQSATVGWWAELAGLFKELAVYLNEWLTDTLIAQARAAGSHFLKNEWSEPVISRKTTDTICQLKILSIQASN